MSERKLATIRTIKEIKEHTNADALEIAVIDGWEVIVKRGEHYANELVVFCEIDSWIPHEVAPFLSKGKEPKEFEGVKGERLRSVKLRGVLSQGLVLPISVLGEAHETFAINPNSVGADVSEHLNIKKWERPLNPQLVGQAKGYFPIFLRKTDQERVQNQFSAMLPEHFADEYEVTLKLDGSSCTFYHKDGEVGVCSRNLELKINDENSGNAFVKKFIELGLEEKLKALGQNIAIQGELWGSGINGNWEGVSDVRFSVFDVFDIDKQQYISAPFRHHLCDVLNLEHVPVIAKAKTLENFKSVQDLLHYAERPSVYNKVAEGCVWKSISNPEYSFKAVANSYLLGGGE